MDETDRALLGMKRSRDTDQSSLVYCGSGFFGVKPGQGTSAPPTDGSVLMDDGCIYTFQLNESAGACQLVPHASVPVVKQGGSFPMWIAADESKRFLYVVNAMDTTKPGFVHAYAVKEDGSLQALGRESSQGIVACHIAVVGKTLLVANFVGGSVAALPIKSDGSLGIATSVHTHSPGFVPAHASGRQGSGHPHQVAPDPQGKFVLVPDLGTNSVIIYELDATNSKLTRTSEVVLHEGCGPRHLAFSPVSPFVYVLGELDNTLTPFHYDAEAGKLRALEIAGGGTVSTLPAGTPNMKGGGAAEVIVSRDGRHAYASVRCTGKFNASEPSAFNCIAVFSLDKENGACAWVHSVHSGGNMPWVMTFNPNGNLLLVSNQHARHTGMSEKEGGSNEGHNGEGPGLLVIFKRDVDTGMLMHSGVTAVVPQLVSITVVETGK